MHAPLPPKRLISRRALLSTVGLAGLAGVGTIAYPGLEALSLSVTDYRITPPKWPAGQRLTVTVIADLHAGGPNMGLARIHQIVEVANALKSDVVVLLGDYFATHRFVTEKVPHDAWAGALALLRARFGVWAILGNHDWWHDIEGVRRALAGVRMPVLENDAVLLGDEFKFWVAGIGDQLAYRLGRRRYRGIDDLPGTLAKVTTDDPVVLLVHEPDIFPEVPERVAITLAGHTHGGQLRIPFVWPTFVPSSYGARFAYGHVVEDNRNLVVSGGLGTSFVPARFGVPPEIVRITLG
jgi:predicted MPP superfamily phosphohydrolase